MESYLNLAPCLYFSSLDDGTILECNETLCRQLGYERQVLIGAKIDKLFTVATKIFQQTHLFPLLKMQGFANEIFITLLSSEGEHLPVLINVERKLHNDKTISAFIGIVVHNRKKFEDELVAARKAAETALNENTSLLEAKRQLQQTAEQLDQQLVHIKTMNAELLQFNRVVTHDLQEPLRKLFVFSNMLLEADTSDSNNKTVRRIKSVLEQMRSIVSGLQQFVWLAETERKPVSIDLEKLVRLIKSELEKLHVGIAIHLSIKDLTTVVADREQMYFLLAEIFGNAVRFRKSPDEVFIHISADILQLNQFKETHDKYKYEDYIRIEIRDEGVGFDGTYKDQVFELFKRLHPASGSGIGLSLCKKIVENHGGAIAVNSAQNNGTTITILLPLINLATAQNEEIEKRQTLIATDGS